MYVCLSVCLPPPPWVAVGLQTGAASPRTGAKGPKTGPVDPKTGALGTHSDWNLVFNIIIWNKSNTTFILRSAFSLGMLDGLFLEST